MLVLRSGARGGFHLGGGRDSIAGAADAISLDSRDRVLIIIAVILAHLAFLVVRFPSDGLVDLLAGANGCPESLA